MCVAKLGCKYKKRVFCDSVPRRCPVALERFLFFPLSLSLSPFVFHFYNVVAVKKRCVSTITCRMKYNGAARLSCSARRYCRSQTSFRWIRCDAARSFFTWSQLFSTRFLRLNRIPMAFLLTKRWPGRINAASDLRLAPFVRPFTHQTIVKFYLVRTRRACNAARSVGRSSFSCCYSEFLCFSRLIKTYLPVILIATPEPLFKYREAFIFVCRRQTR